MIPKHQNTDYLDLLEKTLIYSFWPENHIDCHGAVLDSVISDHEREVGMAAWPSKAFSMIGRLRMRNIRDLCSKVISENTPGDFAECGVWRGGACIYARACLPTDRIVHVCDSFNGFPEDEPEPDWFNLKCLQVTQSEVAKNFEKFDLLDGVHFVPGFFRTSLRDFNRTLAILRLDGDSYSNTIACLTYLWSKVSSGGFIILDDYLACQPVKNAINDFFGHQPEMNVIDQWGAWFQKKT